MTNMSPQPHGRKKLSQMVNWLISTNNKTKHEIEMIS